MRFTIDAIYRDQEYYTYTDKRPLSVKFTTVQDTPENVYYFDLAAKHLQSFKRFQEAVADEYGIWLDDPATMFQDWEKLIASGFEAGRLEKKILSGPSPEEIELETQGYEEHMRRQGRSCENCCKKHVDHGEHVDADKIRGFAERRLKNAKHILNSIDTLGKLTEEDFSFLVGPADVDLSADGPEANVMDVKGVNHANTP